MRTLLLLAAACLAGCTLPYRPPQFLEADARFPGLIDFTARAPDRKADVLLVHGICTHDAAWAKATVGTLAAQLAANVTPVPQGQTQRLAGPAIEIVPIDVGTPHGRIRFTSLIWSPLTTPLKQQLCYDQTDKSPICTGAPPFTAVRAKLNAKVKDWLLDDCLPDALVYQGAARDQIQLRMREAILAATEEADPTAPLVVISESLGSKILFDTLLRMAEEPAASRAAQVAAREMRRAVWLVMAANQLPLLHLADQPLDEAARAPSGAEAGTATEKRTVMQAPSPDSLQRLLQKRRVPLANPLANPLAIPRAVPTLMLVAFSDPSDVLSYTLPPERYREAGAGVFNVLVSNAPTYFGLFQDPVRGHTEYLSNPDIGSLIACGRPRSALCR
ncbi:hypothetical protein GJV26_17290 [Massilia dura]|uniref:Uncharacterized protein n=1 Tax=Pseudoduganella dura TaxID=321982 RepID=A0A6I3XC92_9BURK|nr:hypothetical protein [Pseudoduganella dura]MUI14199.1 hypothetical protein [Pseudoduganella dura]GGX76523.1 hypothetical protein GCM10007386_04430 [Pseudoduganella dura]